MSETAAPQKKLKPAEQQEIADQLSAMRAQQKAMAEKVSTIDTDRREYELILQTLKETDPERTAYQMIGGVLVEKKVKEVIPSLQTQTEQMVKVMEAISQNMVETGKNINTFIDKHQIKFVDEKGQPIERNSGDKKPEPVSS